MAEQSLLGRLGMRLGILGSSASLAIAAPLASGNYDPTCHTDAARIGWYFDRTAGAEAIGMVVGGKIATVYTRSGTSVNLTMPLPSPGITVGDGTSGGTFAINGATGSTKYYSMLTAGVLRWEWGANNTAESGSNNGTDFVWNAYTDAGALIDTPLTIQRKALGTITMSRPLLVAAGTLTTNTTAFQSTVTWNNAGVTFTAWSLNVTDTASNAASVLLQLSVGGTSRYSVSKTGIITSTSVDDLTSAQVLYSRTFTLTGSLTDVTQITMNAAIDGAFTITRYNYINIANPSGAATITNGCVIRFNANAGTHKAVDAGTTKVTVTGVDAWMKHNINGTIYFQPLYLSKTA